MDKLFRSKKANEAKQKPVAKGKLLSEIHDQRLVHNQCLMHSWHEWLQLFTCCTGYVPASSIEHRLATEIATEHLVHGILSSSQPVTLNIKYNALRHVLGKLQ